MVKSLDEGVPSRRLSEGVACLQLRQQRQLLLPPALPPQPPAPPWERQVADKRAARARYTPSAASCHSTRTACPASHHPRLQAAGRHFWFCGGSWRCQQGTDTVGVGKEQSW